MVAASLSPHTSRHGANPARPQYYLMFPVEKPEDSKYEFSTTGLGTGVLLLFYLLDVLKVPNPFFFNARDRTRLLRLWTNVDVGNRC